MENSKGVISELVDPRFGIICFLDLLNSGPGTHLLCLFNLQNDIHSMVAAYVC
jgi:hypothetical protein